ncbi:MAG: tetratricopeptide repeat protein, partial [Bdellovibrionota bacterium]
MVRWIALAAFLGLTACSVDSAKNHYVLAEKLWSDRKYQASVSEFEKVTAKDPHGKLGLQALYRAAVTQSLFLSQFSDAIRKFKSYAESSHDGPSVWDAEIQVGEIYFNKTEQYDQAVQHYQRL